MPRKQRKARRIVKGVGTRGRHRRDRIESKRQKRADDVVRLLVELDGVR